MIVMKFGGTSVGDGKRILDAAKLIKNETRKKVVVVSAMGGVTDKLVGTAEKVVTLPATVVGEEVGCLQLRITGKRGFKRVRPRPTRYVRPGPKSWLPTATTA